MSDRNYLIFEDAVRDDSVKLYFDACAAAVSDGSARISKTRAKQGYPQYECFRAEGREVLVGAVLSYYLYQLGNAGFDCEKARDFSEKMRKLAGFDYLFRPALSDWVNRCLRNPYFLNTAPEDSFYKKWELNPDEPHDFIPEDYFKFACYVAICHLKYGQSFESVTANEIFGFVTALGSDLPARLKKYGSGDLPKEITEYKDDNLSCKANDAFATIRITMKADSEASYAKALDFLCALLEVDFPRSYAIDFKSPYKGYLPIKGLPKKGVNQLFANASHYGSLHEKIERYAWAAMREDEWYTNLEDENCAMPGTFAVFALSMISENYDTLTIRYLNLCDAEHSSIQGKFLPAYIEEFGLDGRSVKVLLAGVGSMQELPPNKIYSAAIANEDSLRALLSMKQGTPKHIWRSVLYALWGKDAIYDKGVKTLKAAPPELRPLIEQILAQPVASANITGKEDD
jgi:hypothetical protein